MTILLWAVCSAGAQNAAKNWIFGNSARINFNSGSPVATSLPAAAGFAPSEGSASISDSSGNLLFYTNGIKVWNRNDEVMPSVAAAGTGLHGHESSTQSALIVPCSCSKYFIFTTGAYNTASGLQYSVVDMMADGGLGDIPTIKNVQLVTPAAEKIAAVKDGSGGTWVVAHTTRSSLTIPGGDLFYAYRILAGSDCTVNTTAVISQVGTAYSNGSYRFAPGQMKISPDGTRLAVAGFQSNASFIELFGFNTATGAVSSFAGSVPKVIIEKWAYGIEFSPNSRYLYAATHMSTGNFIYRYDISDDTLFKDAEYKFSNVRQRPGSMQLATDGKIYIANWNSLTLNVITEPDSPSTTLAVDTFTLANGSGSTWGLPAMVAGDFSCSDLPPSGNCSCDQVTQTPFWTPDLSLAWKALSVYNVKTPASDICSIDIDIRSSSNSQPPNPWAGGGLKVNGALLPVPAWWRSPYVKIPNGTNMQTVIDGHPSFNSAAVNLNLGQDYSVPYTGKIKLIIRHCDGTSCEWLSDNWTPEPPPQVALKVSESYLSDLRSEFLPLTLGFSGGVNMRRNVKWIAIEPTDDDTQVFSTDAGGEIESEDRAGKQQFIITSARKQDKAALYDLARPINLERSAGGEIKLVLKRPSGNPIKPRLRFIFFDENANIIGSATNEDNK